MLRETSKISIKKRKPKITDELNRVEALNPGKVHSSYPHDWKNDVIVVDYENDLLASLRKDGSHSKDEILDLLQMKNSWIRLKFVQFLEGKIVGFV